MPEIMTSVYLALLSIGSLEILWCMQLVARAEFIVNDPSPIRWARRISLCLTGFGLLWAIRYCIDRKWQPWAPDILLVAGLDLYLGVAIYSAYHRMKRYLA